MNQFLFRLFFEICAQNRDFTIIADGFTAIPECIYSNVQSKNRFSSNAPSQDSYELRKLDREFRILLSLFLLSALFKSVKPEFCLQFYN